MNGHWVTGFVDGEGSFTARLQKNSQYSRSKTVERKTARRSNIKTADTSIVVEFSIALRADDIGILTDINEYFGGNKVYESTRKNPTTTNQVVKSAHFSIKRKGLLHDNVIPHFEEYPLRSKKLNDYLLWREVVEILHHRTKKLYTPYMYEYLKYLISVISHNRQYGSELISVGTVLPQLHYHGSSEELENLYKERLKL